MTKRGKRALLFLLAAALLSLSLLSTSLSSLQLQNGVAFPAVDPQYAAQSQGSAQGRTISLSFLQGVLGLLLLLLMIYVPARLILLVRARWLLWIIQVLVVFLAAAILFSFVRFDTDCPAGDCQGTGISTSPVSPVSSLESPPLEIMYFAGILLAAAAGSLVFTVIRQMRRPAQDRVAQHAGNAVKALRSGRDFRNVIIQCYSQMEADLKDERGIERSASMTSREFEALLASRGFPPGPVHELTRLFEKVRYSREELNTTDETMALESLRQIDDFSKGNLHG